MTIRRCTRAVAMGWLLAFLVLPTAGGAAGPFDSKYPFETAIIHLEFGGMMSGGGTVWIDGDRMARHEKRTTTVMGIQKDQEQWTITTPASILIWEVGEDTAIRAGNPATVMREKYRELSASEREIVARNSKKMGNVFLAGMGGGTQKKGTFLGYDVDIIEVMGTEQYLLAGTPLVVKQEGGMAGFQMSETATKIEAGVPIPAEKFELPANVRIVASPGGDLATRMAVGTFEALKDPDYEKKMRARQAQAAPGMPPGADGQPDMAEAMRMMQEMMKKMPQAGAAK